jgi:hypothetical protein
VLTGQLPLAVKIAVVVAFFQAGVTATFVIILIFERNALAGGYGFSLYSLIDVIALTGFAFALLKGRLWAAYGLFAYGVLDWVGKFVRSGQVGWVVPVAVYGIGAMTLSWSGHLTPKASELRWKRAVLFAALWFAGNFVIGFVCGFYGLTRGGVPQEPVAKLILACLSAVWGTTISYAAARRTIWPFETALLVATLTAPFAVLDFVSIAESPLLSLGRVVWAVAFGMIGWALATISSGRKSIA